MSNLYRTHLIISNRDTREIEELVFDDFRLLIKPEPSNCYFEIDTENGFLFSHYTYGQENDLIRHDENPQGELIIQCENENQAEDLLSLIKGGLILGYPDISLVEKFGFIDTYREENLEIYKELPFINYFKRLGNMKFACMLANIAIKNKQVCYAIEKYKISLELDSFTPHSANPKYGQIFDNYDIKHYYHSRAAFAIISAFSVIEELGLEIRSSQKNPRFNNVDTGEWNPKVLDNILKRLKEISVEETDTTNWVYRGNPTRIEHEIKPFFGYDSKWIVYGNEVRDKTLTYPEAIHNASFLRNFIAAHKFNKLTQYISPYDVYNVQSLARELILLKLGLFKKMKNI